jgi:hypothetical protein
VDPTEPPSGHPQLLLLKTELRSWLSKKFCDGWGGAAAFYVRAQRHVLL